jgi:hypothetical protein
LSAQALALRFNLIREFTVLRRCGDADDEFIRLRQPFAGDKLINCLSDDRFGYRLVFLALPDGVPAGGTTPNVNVYAFLALSRETVFLAELDVATSLREPRA